MIEVKSEMGFEFYKTLWFGGWRWFHTSVLKEIICRCQYPFIIPVWGRELMSPTAVVKGLWEG